MSSIIRNVLFLTIMLINSSHLTAEPLDTDNFYVGAGVSFNTLSAFGSATGVQIFGGYDMDVMFNGDIDAALEVGYMDSGSFNDFGSSNKFFGSNKSNGMWLAMPFRVAINSRLDTLMRVGVDFCDDDGLIVGAGLGYNMGAKAAFRIEYVVRDHINGLQFNVLFKL